MHKKNDKQIKTNYRPISLLSCTGKVLERIVFASLYEYCSGNNLLTWRNSGFKPFDSTINQLTFMVHKMYEALERGEDICLVFLDVSKAFDKVFHEGLIFKLASFGVEGTLLQWFKSHLAGRSPRVVINGQESDWLDISAGVPQGSILGPLLFVIYVNDIVDQMETNPFLFADDTSLMECITDPNQSFARTNRDLERLDKWADQWRVTFNAQKTEYMIVSLQPIPLQYPELHLNGVVLKQVTEHTHLGLTFNNKMTWDDHITRVVTASSKLTCLLKRLYRRIPRHSKSQIYTTFIRPKLEYACNIF